MVTKTSMEYAKLCMSMQLGNARYSADPVDLGAQSGLIGAPEPMSTEAVLAAPNGGYGLSSGGHCQPQNVISSSCPAGSVRLSAAKRELTTKTDPPVRVRCHETGHRGGRCNQPPVL